MLPQDLVNQREMATEDERAALATMCLWQGDVKSAKLFVMNTLFQITADRNSVVVYVRAT